MVTDDKKQVLTTLSVKIVIKTPLLLKLIEITIYIELQICEFTIST